MGNTESTQRLRQLAGRTAVRELRETSREILGELLDRRGRVHNGRLNDYRGLMERAECTQNEINEHRQEASPTQSFLRNWERLATAKGLQVPTILDLWRILEELGRHDVLQAAHQTVDEDMRVCQQTAPVQYRNVGPCITNYDVQTHTRIRYDAFVMSVSSDAAVLRKLINIAEGTNGLKLLVPERDILFGLPEFDTWAYAIEKRCKKLILLVSREFMRSERCEFVVKFAQALSPEDNASLPGCVPATNLTMSKLCIDGRVGLEAGTAHVISARNTKIIPIKVEDTIIPQTLNFVKCFCLRSGDCWDLLIAAIRAPSNMERSVSDPGHFAMVQPLPRVPNDRDTVSRDDEDQCVAGMAHLDVRHSAPETIYRMNHPQMVEESLHSVARNPPGTSFHLGSDDEVESVLSNDSSFCCVRAINQDGVLNNLNMSNRSEEDNNASGSRVVGELNDSARGAERRPLSDVANIRHGDGEENTSSVGDSMRNDDNAFDSADGQDLNATTRNMRDRRRPVATATVVYRSDTSSPDNQTVDKRNSTASGDLPACHIHPILCGKASGFTDLNSVAMHTDRRPDLIDLDPTARSDINTDLSSTRFAGHMSSNFPIIPYEHTDSNSSDGSQRNIDQNPSVIPEDHIGPNPSIRPQGQHNSNSSIRPESHHDLNPSIRLKVGRISGLPQNNNETNQRQDESPDRLTIGSMSSIRIEGLTSSNSSTRSYGHTDPNHFDGPQRCIEPNPSVIPDDHIDPNRSVRPQGRPNPNSSIRPESQHDLNPSTRLQGLVDQNPSVRPQGQNNPNLSDRHESHLDPDSSLRPDQITEGNFGPNVVRYTDHQTVGLNPTSPTSSGDASTFQYAPMTRHTSRQVGRIPDHLRQNSNETNERQDESPDIITYV